MLRPKVDISEFKKYGFKQCKGIPSDNPCLYLCVSRGCKMIFVSPVLYAIDDWKDSDPRIHARANCRYGDALDITYELIKADLLEIVG